jgi:hypothetical protein
MPKTRRTVRDDRDKLAGVREKVSHSRAVSDDAAATALETTERAITIGNALIERAAVRIRRNPIKSVLLAFGVGYVGTRLIR